MGHQGVEKQEHEVVAAEVELTEDGGVMEDMEMGIGRSKDTQKCWLER